MGLQSVIAKFNTEIKVELFQTFDETLIKRIKGDKKPLFCLCGGNYLSEEHKTAQLKIIKKWASKAPILFITDTVEPKSIKNLFSQNLIDGIILQDAMPDEFLIAFEKILKNEVYIGSGIDLNKSRTYHLEVHQQEGAKYLLHKLTNRENEILKEVALGATSTDIANKYFLSAYTVKTHRKNILKKLGVANTLELISFLQSAGYDPK